MRGVTISSPPENLNNMISTHTPHARRDNSLRSGTMLWRSRFQLTRLMRGVTYRNLINLLLPYDFNSHASCEAWLWLEKSSQVSYQFQLTRLMRGVTATMFPQCRLKAFQLTRLMRGVTWTMWPLLYGTCNFNSHASCEAWLHDLPALRRSCLFQLTRLMRGVTSNGYGYAHDLHISTHTPHARRDRLSRV